MPTPDVERKRLSRQRQRAQQRAKVAKPFAPAGYLRRPFSEFLTAEVGTLSFLETFDFVGVDVSGDLFEETQAFNRQTGWEDHGDLAPYTSLSRATALVEVFIEAAAELAKAINAYKLAELDARIVELTSTPPATAEATRAAFEEHTRLTGVRDELEKQVRRSFAAIKTKEELQT